MIRCLALLSIISITFTSTSSNINNSIESEKSWYKKNAYRVFSESTIDLSKENKFDDFWTPKNEGYLDEAQKEKLNVFKEKVNNGEKLTITEASELKVMKAEVIKKKLGEEKYKELEKLIKKREDTLDLTLPERQRLYELNIEARE